ncbi:unnamed protein product [Orchesella dallaii]|uniref:Gustatory receptor n=1 Tax=Orchesella dallaii TaxID=48710 RepID=A0ABP1PNR5_9HEXA
MKSSDVVALLNRMIKFEIHRNVKDMYKWRSGIKKEHDLRRKLCGPTLRIFTFTSISIPFLSQLSFIRNPCIPIQPGFFLIKKCNTVESPIIPGSSFIHSLALPLPSIIPTLTLSGITFIMRMFMITACNSQICMIAPIKAYCFQSYQLYTKMIIQRHFLFQKATLKVNEIRTIKFICTLLREVQILVQNFNHAYMWSIVCCLLFAVSGQILSLYAFVVVGDLLPPERRFIYGFAAFDMIMCILLFYGLLGNIYELSMSALNALKSSEAFMTRRVNSKFLKSCPALNICLGSANFIEKITPLNCQSFVVQRYVDLSLLTGTPG